MPMPNENLPFYLGNFQTGNIIRPPDYCDPIGPSFSKAKKWKINIEGTELMFLVPKHKPRDKDIAPKYPDASYSYDVMPFRELYREGLMLKNDWRGAGILYHSWAFQGPFLTGPLATIGASLIVLNHKHQPENTSYFHPRVFEHTLTDFLTNRYAMHKADGGHVYIAPVNWAPVIDFPVPAVRLKVISNDELRLYEEVDYFFFTLDDHHIAYFAFQYDRLVRYAVTKADLDKHVGDKNMHELVDNVINSVSITLSSDARAQQQKALQGLDDTSLTKTFPPLKWDRDVEAYTETQRKLAGR